MVPITTKRTKLPPRDELREAEQVATALRNWITYLEGQVTSAQESLAEFWANDLQHTLRAYDKVVRRIKRLTIQRGGCAEEEE